MHELGITRNVVAICAERAQGAQVLRVQLEIGKRAGVMAESVRFCFEICAKGTAVEGALLEIIEPLGEELKIKEMEVV
jgi:hydrogenase nickel incorporation protein HypA/HybF